MNGVRVSAAVGLSLSLGTPAWAGEVLYAVGSGIWDGSCNVYRIDDPLGSPVAFDIGESGTGLLDIAISPVTGKAYGISGPTLLSIDLLTGQANPIGDQAHDETQNALEFTPDGTLYSWGGDDKRLFRVDPATGAAEPVFDLGFFSGGDLAAVSDTLLYGTEGQSLIEIDIAKGTSTLIGSHELEFMFLYGLELDSAGNLIGLSGAEGEEAARLFSVDRQTGKATLIGDIPDSYLLGGYGLAYAVPAPGGAAVGAVALLAACRRRRSAPDA